MISGHLAEGKVSQIALNLLQSLPVLQFIEEHCDQGRGSFEIVYNHLQHKTLPAGQLHRVQLFAVNFPAVITVSGVSASLRRVVKTEILEGGS